MGVPIREFLMLVTETVTYGTPKASPVPGTDSLVVRLDEGNAFDMQPVPVTVDVNAGGGRSVKGATVGSKTELKGKLKLKLCYSQAELLLGWGLTPVNSGKTSPWTTPEPAGDLASMSVYHALYLDDTGGYQRRRVGGVKCTGGKLDVSEESQVMQLELDLQGSTHHPNEFGDSTAVSGTDFPVPTEDQFATDFVAFGHSSGGLFLGSLVTARAQYWNLSQAWTNKVEAAYFAKRFAQRVRCYGREMSLDSEVMLVSSPDDVTTFNQLGALAAKVVYTDGTSTLTFDYQGNNRIKGLAFDTTLDRAYRRKLSLEGRMDGTAGTDFAFTVS